MPGPHEQDRIEVAVRRFEMISNQLGMALQTQNQQSASFRQLLSTLQTLLSDLLSTVVANRETLLKVQARLDDASRHRTGKGSQESAYDEDTPFVLVRPLGNLGNRMIQHMVALSIASRVPGARIPWVQLPEWGLVKHEIDETLVGPGLAISSMAAHPHQLAARMRNREIRAATISGYVQHIDNLLGPEAYKRVFVTNEQVAGFGPEYLLISLRMAEVTDGRHPPYVLLPISFYRQVISETGLKPVFFGQLTNSDYLSGLRRSFPEALFVGGRSPIHDFETIRRSRNILLSVSTFAWLAGWLSEADQVIMPLAGLFHPLFGKLYAGGHYMIPRNDPRFRFHLFPLGVATRPENLSAYHDAIDGLWRGVTSLEIEALVDRHEMIDRSFEDHARLFDDTYYLCRYPELRDAIRDGHIESGRHHYELHGFREKRPCFELDQRYSIRYPDAGAAVSDGKYYDLRHFHATQGHALGYRAVPRSSTPVKRRRVTKTR